MDNKYSQWLFGILFLLPLAKGLFYKEHFYFASILIAIFLIYFIVKQKVIYFEKKFTILMILQAIFSVIGLFRCIKIEDAVYGILKNAFCTALFFIVYNVFIEDRNKSIDFLQKRFVNIQKCVFWSGALISALNILFINASQGEDFRLKLIIEYSNTLAIFLLICSIIGAYLFLQQSNSFRSKFIIGIGVVLNLTAMILTLSRTVWIISIVVFIIFILKTKLICKIKSIKILSIITLLGIIPIAGIIIFKAGYIYSRIMSISFGASELQERFAYYKDSVKIIADYPLTGTGYGGWASIQYTYQTALYATKYVHNFLLQIALDYGIPALVIFIMQIFLVIFPVIKLHLTSNNKELKSLINISFISIAVLMVHSLLDIDFEIPFIAVIFWVNIAFLLSVTSKNVFVLQLNRNAFKIPGVCLIAIQIVVLIPLFISSVYYSDGIAMFSLNKYTESIDSMNKAIKFNPYSSDSLYIVGESCKSLYAKNKDDEIMNKGLNALIMAKKYDRFSPKYPAVISYIARLSRDYSTSIGEYRDLISKQPLVIEYYEALAITLFEKAQKDANLGNSKDAMDGYTQVTQIETSIRSAEKKVSKTANNLKHKVNLGLTPKLKSLIGQSYYLLGEKERSKQY